MQQANAAFDPYFRYLDRLNKLDVANMKVAGIFLEARFLIGPEEAEQIIDAWFETCEKAMRD